MTGGNFELLDQEEGRGALHGIDYGPRWKVLVRRGDKWLLWVPGHAAWNGTGQASRYAAATMYITNPRQRGAYARLVTGGRLKRVLTDQSARIDAEFGEGVSKLIEPGRTLVIA